MPNNTVFRLKVVIYSDKSKATGNTFIHGTSKREAGTQRV